MANKIAVPLSIAHDEEASRVPIGETFCMWDVASRKVYMELVLSKSEGGSTTRSCMLKNIKIRRGELYLPDN